MSELIPAGVHIGVPELIYHKDPAFSYSGVKHAHPTLADYHQWKTGPPESPTRYMNAGSLIGRLVLEPDRPPMDGFIIKPEPRAPNGWQKEQDALGNMVLSESELVDAKGCAASLRSDSTAGPILTGKGLSEVTLVWETFLLVDDSHIPVRIRCRVDRVPHGVDYLSDIKKVQDCSPGRWCDGKTDKYWKQSPFSKVIGDRFYHVQAGIYLRVWNELVPEDPRSKWVFCCVEQDAPHKVKCFELETDAIWEGENLFWRFLKNIVRAEMTGNWPGYDKSIETIGLEKWASI